MAHFSQSSLLSSKSWIQLSLILSVDHRVPVKVEGKLSSVLWEKIENLILLRQLSYKFLNHGLSKFQQFTISQSYLNKNYKFHSMWTAWILQLKSNKVSLFLFSYRLTPYVTWECWKKSKESKMGRAQIIELCHKREFRLKFRKGGNIGVCFPGI